MVASFSFNIHPALSLVRITMAGFFEEQDLARFFATQDEAYRELRCAPNTHVTLVDIRDMQIQSQASVSAFRERLSDRRMAARRIAFVVSRSLARGQIIRAAETVNAEFFTDPEEALTWLLA